jgi:hypothetical protein
VSATVEERLKALEGFSPKVVATILDEDGGLEFQLTFYPTLNAFKIHRSDEPKGLPIPLPVLAISMSDFVDGMKLNKANRIDRLILAFREEWNKIPQEEREAFYNDIPLNSLYFGANPPIQ